MQPSVEETSPGFSKIDRQFRDEAMSSSINPAPFNSERQGLFSDRIRGWNGPRGRVEGNHRGVAGAKRRGTEKYVDIWL